MTLEEAMKLIDEFGPNCLLAICCPPGQQCATLARMIVSKLGKVSEEEIALAERIAGIVLDHLDIAPKDSISPLLRKAGELACEND